MLGSAGIFSILEFFVMLCMPESPRWLGKVEKTSKAEEVM
jgi:hypothetical protein